jgi:hypothetical protein
MNILHLDHSILFTQFCVDNFITQPSSFLLFGLSGLALASRPFCDDGKVLCSVQYGDHWPHVDFELLDCG